MATHGFYVDVTPSERERQDQVTAAVTVIAEARAGIEQAKGMLMLIYGMDLKRPPSNCSSGGPRRPTSS